MLDDGLQVPIVSMPRRLAVMPPALGDRDSRTLNLVPSIESRALTLSSMSDVDPMGSSGVKENMPARFPANTTSSTIQQVVVQFSN